MGFLKVLFNNVLAGPSTDPYPLGPTFTPDRLRGKCVIDPDLCVGCGVCKSVCVSGAIDITQKADGSGYTITVWRNSCCLCATCRHYCPTGAMTLNNDWHLATLQDEKFQFVEQHEINYSKCPECGEFFRPAPLKLVQKLYAFDKELDPEKLRLLCPKCRRVLDAKKSTNYEEKTAQAIDNTPGGVEVKMESPQAAAENVENAQAAREEEVKKAD